MEHSGSSFLIHQLYGSMFGGQSGPAMTTYTLNIDGGALLSGLSAAKLLTCESNVSQNDPFQYNGNGPF